MPTLRVGMKTYSGMLFKYQALEFTPAVNRDALGPEGRSL